jgi:Flp pilus assembly pilin Flp
MVREHARVITMIVNRLRRLAGETRGQDMIEYALMAGLLVLAAAAIMLTW